MFKHNMTKADLQSAVDIFCEFNSPRIAELFRGAVEQSDLEQITHLVRITTGSLKRQLDYTTEKVAYGPSTRSEHASARRVVTWYTPERRERLYEAHKAGRAVYLYFRYQH